MKTFEEEFPSFEDEFFHGENKDLVRKIWVEKNCKDNQRVKEVANKLQEKFDKIYTFEDTIPSMYELLEELGLK